MKGNFHVQFGIGGGEGDLIADHTKVGIGTWEESPLWRWTFEEHGWSKASLLAQHCSLLPPSCVLHLSCATFPSHKGWIRMSYQGLFS